MPDTLTIDCRICGGIRPVLGAKCGGCATPIQNAVNRSVSKPSQIPPCPRCGSRRALQVVPDRFSCKDCGAHFERDDFGFLDDRPDVNLDKKQSRERSRKRRA